MFPRTHAIGTVAACLVMGLASALGEPVTPEGDAADLERLLERLGRLAQLFEDSALAFGCEETITWRELGHSDRHKFAYVYARNESGEIEDYRTWVRGGRKNGVPREISPGEYGVPAYLRSAYLWVFAFKESRRESHRYRLAGNDTVLERPAIGIRFEPIPPHRDKVNDWFGTAWVDADTSQLLRVVAYAVADHEKKAKLEAHLAGDLPRMVLPDTEVATDYTIQRITTDFGFEKNGMRFPERVTIERDRHKVIERGGSLSSRKTRLLRVDQVYTKYQFYGVRTAEEIRGFISGR